MTSEQYIKSGKLIALISFFVGTIIFGLYYWTSAFKLLFIGYGFIALMGILNIVFLVAILIKSTRDQTNRKKLLHTSGFMLLNIPILIIYCWIAVILLGTMRITFTNGTEANLTDINIVGCGGGHIDKLSIGESKTVWVKITGDCSISINYLSNGKRNKESVAGYVTHNMGEKVKYRIEGKDKELFL